MRAYAGSQSQRIHDFTGLGVAKLVSNPARSLDSPSVSGEAENHCQSGDEFRQFGLGGLWRFDTRSKSVWCSHCSISESTPDGSLTVQFAPFPF